MYKKATALALSLSLFAGFGTAEASTGHVVESGDTLYKIGQNEGMDYGYIYRANNLTSTLLTIGQVLEVPTMYTVKSGDSLWLIASKFGVTVDSIRHVNNKWNTDLINIGEVLLIADGIPKEEQVEEAPKEVTNTTNLSNEEFDVLSRIVHAEAKGEPFEGKVAVANVIMNRVDSSDFPNDVKSVVYEQGQFEPVSNGTINAEATESSKEAVRVALEGTNYIDDALFFWAESVPSTSWVWTREVTTQIGHHVFAK